MYRFAETASGHGTSTEIRRGSLYNTFDDERTMVLRGLDDYCTDTLDGLQAQLRDPEVAASDRLVVQW